MLRSLLVLALLLAAAACLSGGDGPTAPTPSPSAVLAEPPPTATPTPAPTPTPTPTPSPPPFLDLPVAFPQQGGFLLVRLVNPPPGLKAATVEFAGASYAMLPEGDPSTLRQGSGQAGSGQAVWYAVIGLGTDFPPGEYGLAVAGDEVLASTTVAVAEGGFGQEYVDVPPESGGLLGDAAAIEEEKRTLERVYAGFVPERLWSGAWILPAQGPITNAFGLQRSINGGPFSPHSGTDFAAEAGSPAVAAASGRVAFAGPLHLRGNSVIVDHGAGVFSGYHHLDSIAVAEGQPVTVGDLLGYVGATGLVSGPHLHWEAIVRGVRVDPALWTYGPVEP